MCDLLQQVYRLAFGGMSLKVQLFLDLSWLSIQDQSGPTLYVALGGGKKNDF